MGKNIKQQFIYAIEDNFQEGMDKHSMKSNGIRNDGKVFSYADRKNLIDVACNFANFMKENYNDIKLVKEIKADHIQSFLNQKASECSNATLKQYQAKFNKLEKIVNKTYSLNVKYKGYQLPLTQENTKIRNTSMLQEDFKKLERAFDTSKSYGRIAIQLTARCGLRVAECTKLQGRDINLKDDIIHVEGGKGGRDRDIPIREDDKQYFIDLKANIGDKERVCPVRSDSINKAIDRAMERQGIRNKYNDTNIHSIRKMYAQREFNRCRSEGKNIKESLQEVSVLLGHGQDRLELMKQYVLDIH
ncbi:tyrosine-type recombinase/integrase [Clostridium butyricum]|uniref:tyrosine-type recombinase/integrase n=1 Tax=Clostridium butyricum TaxID=1492 RepID=UPI0022DF4DE7|nr:tyrosine-type recombinase/integrase [Clostridium butyricum]